MSNTVSSRLAWMLLLAVVVFSTTAAIAREAEFISQDAPQRRGFGRGVEGMYKGRIEPHWLADNRRFWYRNDLRGETKEFILVDAQGGTRNRAFDHAKLAESLSTAAEREFDAERLPFDEIEFTDDGASINFVAAGAQWSCNLESYECTKEGDAPAATQGRGGRGFGQQGRGGRGFAGRGRGRGANLASPDGKWTAGVAGGNVVVRPTGDGDEGEEIQLSHDGGEGLGYGLLEWSPDSKTLFAFRVEPGDEKEVHRIESSPEGGGRAVLHSRPYPLPGDNYATRELNLFNIESRQQTKPQVDKLDFGRHNIRWMPDGRHFAYEKIDRGHQRLRVINVDSHTGEAKNLIDEQTDTFIWTAHAENVGLDLVNWLETTEEIIYASERDGWRQLYLVDAKGGGSKHQITKGDFVVRGIDRIDEENRQIWFQASGKNLEQDPYFIHYYRVNFDGTGLVALTEGDGTHTVQFSPDRKYLVDTYSRVDSPPVHELRRTSDGAMVCPLEEADISELEERGGHFPEPFVAKGRDGVTDIWGIICRPHDFDPSKKYPIIESIYAGPHTASVPKPFVGTDRHSSLTELGFIVVQIDGMGTAHRSKAFHDVCWQNIKDAGFPDRILWMQAAAEKYPYMDTSRVGIYGTSAGGQNAAGAVLFHPDFYKAAVANCGCHDNRLDKASWNEQWMGYPVGPQYSASSNIDNAHLLGGELMLILGEMDDNVPPESTLRFVDALIKADKDFDFIFVPGGGHGAGSAGAYHRRRMHEFFVRHLMDGQPSSTATPTIETVAHNDSTEEEGEGQENAEADDEEQGDAASRIDLASLTPEEDRIANIGLRYRADHINLRRFYFVEESPSIRNRMRRFYIDWLTALLALPEQTSLNDGERNNLNELKDEILAALTELETAAWADEDIEPLVPFAAPILRLAEQRLHVQKVDPQAAAAEVSRVSRHVAEMQSTLKNGSLSVLERDLAAEPKLRERASERVQRLADHLERWYSFYNGYDPAFTWWLRKPYEDADKQLTEYAALLEENASDQKSQGEAGPAPEETVEAEERSTLPDQDVPNLVELMGAEKTRMQVAIERFQSETRRGRRGGFRGRFGRGRAVSAGRDQSRRNENSSSSQGATDSEGEREAQDATGDSDEGEQSTEDGEENGRQQRERQRERTAQTHRRWLASLEELEFETLSRGEQVDYLLLKNHINQALHRFETDRGQREQSDGDADDVVEPIGREALLSALDHAMIAYGPEQLIKIAEAEYAWCQAEIKRASREMGFGDDWRAAVEKVKTMHVAPGEQPQLIRELAWEAIDYLKEHELVSVPPIAAETWRMEMMSPERQLVNPFFTGGTTISVSFPTDTMSHEDKLQSMRGNNVPFARATVHHELIPGHNLQAYMNARYATHRGLFRTPFWTEGWALYWEMLLYERGFPKTPEDRIGFLVWRQHRCARIVFSLGYHLGRMTPDECVDYLVDKVGFERNNAAAEVRRSFAGSYEPLYQAAYMLGGLQFRALHEELVDSGKMTDREFHDAILKEGCIPVVMVRALLTDEPLNSDSPPAWLFYGPIEE